MGIFKSLSSVLDDARIAYSFREYERNARVHHLTSAERRFSTTELERDIANRMAPAHEFAAKRFQHPMDKFKAIMTQLHFDLQNSRERLAIFERDYKGDLDALYERKSQLIDELRSINQAKQEAYSDLEDASDDLARWHSKSTRSFFGNGGKALPKHSFFGQSLGDRDELKCDRDSAGTDISSCKEQAAIVKKELDQVSSGIAQVKADRQRMFDMRAKGYSTWGLQRTIRNDEGLLADVQSDIQFLQGRMDEFLMAAKHRTGCASLEEQIQKVRGLREAFIKLFDTTEAVDRRRSEHRKEWLHQRQRAS